MRKTKYKLTAGIGWHKTPFDPQQTQPGKVNPSSYNVAETCEMEEKKDKRKLRQNDLR